MLEHAAREAIAGLKGAGIDFVSGLPDGWQRNLHELIADDPDFRYVPVCNEGVGFSVCAGAWLGGANYFLSLARALGSQPRPGGASVVIATNRPDWFESARGDAVEVRAAPWLDVTARADYSHLDRDGSLRQHQHLHSNRDGSGHHVPGHHGRNLLWNHVQLLLPDAAGL